METNIQDQFQSLTDSFLSYLPNLVGGIILILLGWFLGWVVKRVLVQFSIVLRIDRYLKRSRWESDFSKADVRYGLYNLIGNIGFAIVFLIFLDNALLAWKLNILSELLSKGIVFLPKVIVAVVIIVTGWLLSSWVQMVSLKSLYREQVPRASLISKFIKSMLMIFFSAVSLVELDVAREIIIIGFATIFITLGAIAITLTVIGGKGLLKRVRETLEEDKR